MITKTTIDLAGKLYSEGIEGGWNKVAEILNEQGHKNGNSYIHGNALCSLVLKDPQWQHLRKNRVFSTNKRILIAEALTAEGITVDIVTRIMRRIP